MWPTAAARTSYLVSEQADCLLRGTPTGWLGPASVIRRVRRRAARGAGAAGGPSAVLWHICGGHYPGALVARRRLTPEPAQAGGHTGYHVVSR